MEALRLQLDNLRVELHEMQLENTRLREQNPEAAAEIDARAEADRCRHESEQLTVEMEDLRKLLHESQESEARVVGEATEVRNELGKLQKQLQEHESEQGRELAEQREGAHRRCEELEAQCERLAREAEWARDQAELKHYRALEEERRKWERREERLLEQLCEAQGKPGRPSTPVTQSTRIESPARKERATVTIACPERREEAPLLSGLDGNTGHNGATLEGSVGSMQPALATALLASHMLPPIGKFSGEVLQGEGETFKDWIEQFEMIASVPGWDKRAKLINLTTRLRGQAYSFYRSCTAQQRGDYGTLVAELTKRFTPVRLQSVQSSLFHDRKQKPQETVDAYAQDLRRLFYILGLSTRTARECRDGGHGSFRTSVPVCIWVTTRSQEKGSRNGGRL